MRRLCLVAVFLAALAATAGEPSAQTPSLDDVLKRAASYVADFRRQLSGLVAEETYRQTVSLTGRITNGVYAAPPRTLKSELLLVKPSGSERYVELRDVYEVDGAPIRNRESRLEPLLRDQSGTADRQIADIIEASARYNIGGVTRNINTPLMTLQFLDAANQRRFRFRHVDRNQPVFGDSAHAAANDTPVFRVSTEMWTIAYEERERPTIIRRPDRRDQPAKGRFWINPTDGSVLISELIVDGGGVIATVTVSYQTEPLMGFLVPVEMRESYLGRGERISGQANYGRFRQIK